MCCQYLSNTSLVQLFAHQMILILSHECCQLTLRDIIYNTSRYHLQHFKISSTTLRDIIYNTSRYHLQHFEISSTTLRDIIYNTSRYHLHHHVFTGFKSVQWKHSRRILRSVTLSILLVSIKNYFAELTISLSSAR